MSYKTCPDWPQLMEIAPELQFKHMTVADAQLPSKCCRTSRTCLSARSRSAAISSITCSLRGTPIRRSWPPWRDALVRGARVGRPPAPARRRTRPKSRVPARRPAAMRTLPRVTTVVIPYRGDAKRRLPPELRAAAAMAMLGDVVEAALPLGRVVVVTDDPVVVPPGAELLADPGGGQGAAVAGGSRDRRPATRSSSMPTSARHDGCAAASGCRRARSRRVRRRHDERAVSSRPAAVRPAVRAWQRSPFPRPCAFATVAIPELVDDVDTVADLERLAPLGGRRTRSLLARSHV